jgi:hypothetical protein
VDEMGRTCSMHAEMRLHTIFWLENMKGRGYLEDLNTDGRKNGSIMGWCINYLLASGMLMTQLRETFFKISWLNLVFLRS